jgi:hypothetical protein
MSKLAAIAFHVVVAGIATAVAFAPTWRDGLLQTDPGDTLLNHYILEHGWRWLSDRGYPASFWSPPCFYPAGGTLAYSENMLGVAPIYWAGRLFLDPLPAYQVWMILTAAATYLAAAWTMHRFGATALLAAAGAAAWAYGMPRMNQLGHQQLLGAMYAPPALWFTWQFCREPATKPLALALVFLVLQLLASIYLGWFLALGMACMGGIALVLRESRERLIGLARRPTRADLAVVAAFVVFAAALVAPYARANQGFRRSYRHEIRLMLPRFDSMLSPPPGSLWAEVLPPTDGPLNHEHHVFPGALLYALIVAVAVAAWWRPGSVPVVAIVLLGSAAVLMLISLRFGKISAWSVVYQAVPGAKGIRAVTRIAIFAQLLAWLAVMPAVSAWFRGRPRTGTLTGVVLLLWGLGEQYHPRLPAFDARPFYAEAARLAKELRGREPAYVEPDPECAFWISHLAAMWAGLEAGTPVVNGYSGRTPPGYPDEARLWSRDQLAVWLGGRPGRYAAGVRLAAAFPAPPAPPDRPELDFRPRRTQRDPSCRNSPTKLSEARAPEPPAP